ncbi:MAG: 1-hydroxycarotenoid 3,4-desaturase CrtD [Sphingobacteriia bacterium]
MPKALVVGAGMAGLAASIRLARLGYDVAVYEQQSGPGGKLNVLQLDGYRFDTGPSLFTLPELVTELFSLCQEDPAAYFQYRRLDPITRYFWADGTRLTAWADPERFAQECQQVLGAPAAEVRAFLQQAAAKYRLAAPFFLQQSLHRLHSYTRPTALRALLQLPQLETGRSMGSGIDRRIRHPKLRQLFRRYATYNGSHPERAPATLNLIPHLEFNLGAYLPVGGMYAIAHALEGLARRQGVHFHYNQPVERITVEKQRATGLQVNGSLLAADQVVCNLDVFYAYHRLLPDQKPPERTLRQERSSSALIFYWGINRSFSELDVHNIFFSEDYAGEFSALFADRSLHADPTVYVHITSKQEPQDAPAGCENWFVMINAPSLAGQDWGKLIPRARQHILAKLERMLGQPVAARIVAEQVLGPEQIQANTGSYQGALYGTASNNRFAAFLRHPNFIHRIRNLYFCGGSVHPGGGVPLSLLSGKIVADLIAKR